MLIQRGLNYLLVLSIMGIFFVIWIYSNYSLSLNYPTYESISCYEDDLKTPVNELELMKSLASDTRPPIFFVETSCTSRYNGKVVLNTRQACAVESAAKMNPNSDVYVLFASPTKLNISAHTHSDKILSRLLSYSNVYLRHVNFIKYVQNTPLEKWYESKELQNSFYARSHASDILRYLTLYKYGGTYLDLDIVLTKTLEDIKPNYAGAESWIDVAAGVLNFDSTGVGHDLAKDCVLDLRDNFKGDDWGHNGPGVITRLLKKICKTNNVKLMKPERCQTFKVFPPDTFYAIPWRQWKLFFDEHKSIITLEKIKNSKGIHVWNKFSIQKNITVGSKQPYGIIAKKYCPKVYRESGKYF